MRFRCNVCEARFHDTDQNRSQQAGGQCPICGHEDIRKIEPKVCPVLSQGQLEPQYCIHESCASWSEHFQMCVMSVPAFLNAREEQRMNQEEAQRKAYAEELLRRVQWQDEDP